MHLCFIYSCILLIGHVWLKNYTSFLFSSFWIGCVLRTIKPLCIKNYIMQTREKDANHNKFFVLFPRSQSLYWHIFEVQISCCSIHAQSTICIHLLLIRIILYFKMWLVSLKIYLNHREKIKIYKLNYIARIMSSTTPLMSWVLDKIVICEILFRFTFFLSLTQLPFW